MIDKTQVRFDPTTGLVPGIVQDATTGRVLMLGWLNEEALDRTLSTGNVHFWSRSRQRLWMKGEESGNVLVATSAAVDCDGDTLLFHARPEGPTCHTGTVSCFDKSTDQRLQGFAWLETLWGIIETRRSSPSETSYTSSLLTGGVDGAARKVTEEATEVLMAAKDHANGGDSEPLAEETADLVYHLLVLLAERGVPADHVIETLQRRMAGA